MFYLNDEAGLMGCFIPDTYLATNLLDFINNKGDMPLPRGLRNFLSRTLDLGACVFVEIHDVNVKFRDEGYLLHDLSAELSIEPAIESSDASAQPANIVEGRYHFVILRYSVVKGRSVLHKVQKQTPPRDSEAVSRDLEHRMKVCPGPA